MLSDQLKALKNQKNLTAQEIADRAGVPISTVNKILSGQTDNPGFRVTCDIIKAMGGSVDELIGNVQARRPVDHSVEAMARIIGPYKEAIDTKNRWIYRLFVFCCVLVAVIVIVLLFDLFNPSIGWVRY